MHAMELPLRKIIGFCEHFLFSREAFSLSFGKKYILQHSFIIPLSIQQTNKHLFIHSAPSFRKCLLSFCTGIRHWAGHRMPTETGEAPTLCVSSPGAGIIKMIAPGLKELKNHSFFFSFVHSTSACWEQPCLSASACLWLWLAGSQKEFVQRSRKEQAHPLGHTQCSTTAILPRQSIRSPGRVPVLPSVKQRKRKGKGMINQVCHLCLLLTFSTILLESAHTIFHPFGAWLIRWWSSSLNLLDIC